MNRETYEKQRQYAGPLRPSMKRRAVDHDYHERRIYMITIAVEGRRPLLGKLVGDVRAERGTADWPHVVPTPLGEAVSQAWNNIPRFHQEVRVLGFQLMPDHIHGILFVERPIKEGLGKVILGFKQGCNKSYRSFLSSAVGSVAVPQQQRDVAVVQQQTQLQNFQQPLLHPTSRDEGFLFERGYHDRILLHAGQLDTLRAYLADNPYRLAVKRAHADLLCVRQGVNVCGRSCSLVGNQELLKAKQMLQVRISRSIDLELLAHEQRRILAEAQAGAVLVSPAISPGEKAVMRTAFDARLPLIVLLDNGLDPMSKPSGERFYATAEGRLLLLSPFPHRGERRRVSRDECNQLNALAWDITHAVRNES